MQPEVEEDASLTIRLADEAAFRTWRSIGPRGNLTVDWSPEQHEALTRDMLAVSRRERVGYGSARPTLWRAKTSW